MGESQRSYRSIKVALNGILWVKQKIIKAIKALEAHQVDANGDSDWAVSDAIFDLQSILKMIDAEDRAQICVFNF